MITHIWYAPVKSKLIHTSKHKHSYRVVDYARINEALSTHSSNNLWNICVNYWFTHLIKSDIFAYAFMDFLLFFVVFYGVYWYFHCNWVIFPVWMLAMVIIQAWMRWPFKLSKQMHRILHYNRSNSKLIKPMAI